MSACSVVRWDRHQIVQHLLLVICFSTLLATGMPLRVPKAALSQAIMARLGGAERAGLIHRSAALAFMALAVYHALYLLQRRRRCGLASAMWPRRQDLRDLVQTVRFFLGLTPERPRFGRYSFAQKFDYWAVVLGGSLMIATGLILWFPAGAARILPVVVIDVARVVHGYEALLAASAIVVWHVYLVHLNPASFPMSMTWLTGRISLQELEEDHPLELEAVRETGPEPGAPSAVGGEK